jgi:predicted 3-demethylubiquinone-9 3-methyltransferase (glyoxalase superfamily)
MYNLGATTAMSTSVTSHIFIIIADNHIILNIFPIYNISVNGSITLQFLIDKEHIMDKYWQAVSL